MSMGRPSKYSQEILDKTADYIVNHVKCGDIVPSNAGLACELNISRETVRDWGNTKPEFSAMLAQLQAKQERLLLTNGLTGDFNSNIAKLMLAKHGHTDKVQQDQISSDGTMSPPTKIELIAREITHSYE